MIYNKQGDCMDAAALVISHRVVLLFVALGVLVVVDFGFED